MKQSTVFVAALLCLLGAGLAGWSVVGEPGAVRLSPEGAISLDAKAGVAAGALSAARTIDADAVLVEARVSKAAARAVTFSLHDPAGDGESLGYWQNPLPIEGPASIAAVLDLSRRTRQGRLFAGADGQPSSAIIEQITLTPVRRSVSSRSAVYGVVVDDGHIAGQTYKATGARLEAIRFRIRQLNQVEQGPDLRVRVYAWPMKESAAPLAEAVVARGQIPTADSAGERELAVALHAAVSRGKTYLVQFAPAAACDKQHAFLMWGGSDTYRQGTRIENGKPITDWDLWLDAYEAE